MKAKSFRCKDLKTFSKIFWLNNLSGCLQMVVVNGYIQFAEQILIAHNKFKPQAAGSYIPIPFLIYSVVSPFLGLLIDKIGHRCSLSLTACIILIIDQAWVCFYPRCDQCALALAPLFLQGIANSLTFSLQFGSIIAFTCEPHMLGTAFGIIWSSNNIF